MVSKNQNINVIICPKIKIVWYEFETFKFQISTLTLKSPHLIIWNSDYAIAETIWYFPALLPCEKNDANSLVSKN